MKRHVSLKISGSVQGVGFRASAQAESRSRELYGYAMNCNDGSVCVEVEGEEDVLIAFIAWCKQGPPGAQVTHVHVSDGDMKGYTSFDIRPSSEHWT